MGALCGSLAINSSTCFWMLSFGCRSPERGMRALCQIDAQMSSRIRGETSSMVLRTVSAGIESSSTLWQKISRATKSSSLDKILGNVYSSAFPGATSTIFSRGRNWISPLQFTKYTACSRRLSFKPRQRFLTSSGWAFLTMTLVIHGRTLRREVWRSFDSVKLSPTSTESW